ncbi:MAG: hypothetical protein KKB20_08810 [Proteobacteria bacterium]|nr:hypothetical protein [Pseudomonadota bacterium]
MICDRCRVEIDADEEREIHGRLVCEDCYMDLLSPTRTCDPWAVHSARNIPETAAGGAGLTDLQTRLLNILEETGGVPGPVLAERLNLTPRELEREVAALRHMEKVRGERREGRIVVRLW